MKIRSCIRLFEWNFPSILEGYPDRRGGGGRGSGWWKGTKEVRNTNGQIQNSHGDISVA